MKLNPGVAAHFATRVISWQQQHGRHALPWQNTRDPYRVWLSEIMLQQTQVTTVLGYFDRFLTRFPTVAALAEAQVDDVLGLWSGLGYYSRARNMHRCAQQVVSIHAGAFPSTALALQTLPGIGPSTAAAIASFCYSERVAILDGNVKRVLTRVLAVQEDMSLRASENALLVIANRLLPKHNLPGNMPRYTQGIMDLGATVCKTSKPGCEVCPVQMLCQSRRDGNPEKYPVKTKKIKRSALTLWLLWAENSKGEVWLDKRPANGIWGGLYCFPLFESEEHARGAIPAALRDRADVMPPIKHVLTHKDLQLNVVTTAWMSNKKPPQTSADSAGRWLTPSQYLQLGLPAPIRTLLAEV